MSQIVSKEQAGAPEGTQVAPLPLMKRPRSIFITVLVSLAFILIATGIAKPGFLAEPSATPATQVAELPAPAIPPGTPASLNMGMPGGNSITTLQAPLNAPHVQHFTLVARAAHLTLGAGTQVAAWTFNGTSPGPTLRVHQGDLVVVDVTNRLTFGISIHWHGISVPDSQDGVAGVTQNAIQPGQTYTYRFVANDPGTYWYHSHQFSDAETTGGLDGVIIVDPARPAVHDDVDLSVALHDWQNGSQQILALNQTSEMLNYAARPGQWVRLRLTNTSSLQHLVTLVGAPFMVAALDGHDINAPQMLIQTPLPIGAAQRYDLRFQMPAHGSVTLITSNDNQQYQAQPAVVVGQKTILPALPTIQGRWFDLSHYGQPAPDFATIHSHFDVSYSIILNYQDGSSLGRSGTIYTMNDKIFPDTGMIMVKEGQLVKIHLENASDLVHPIHLHGHFFTVLAYNGKPLTGSPIHLDTINIQPHDSYDIAFLADNPGIWMLHCHNLLHANWGMDMMVDYYGYSTPYTIGTAQGNFPD